MKEEEKRKLTQNETGEKKTKFETDNFKIKPKEEEEEEEGEENEEKNEEEKEEEEEE